MAIVPKADQATRYADDFVIFSCGHAIEAMMWTRAVMTKLGLSLNEAKTSIRERSDGTPWLLVRAALLMEEWRYLGANPSKKSVQRIKAKISELLVPGHKGSWPDVRD